MIINRNIIRKYLFAFLITLSSAFSFSQTVNREYQIKAAFLFNFTQFVEWPSTSFASANTPLVIGILGRNPFGPYLKESVSGEQANGHPIVIQQFNSLDEIKSCHILYINPSESNIDRIAAGLKGKNVLLVSEASGFLDQGGMIRFFTKNNKTQLQINLQATQAANLIISSKLLRLAEIK